MSNTISGKTLANKYRIEDALRPSGLGRVYRGKHLLMDKPVSVKILSPALAIDKNIVDRFSEEARAVSHISHPNILNVTDFGTDGNAVYIVFEGVEGETLKELILREGKLSLERAADIARQIAAGLVAAHRKGYVHSHLSSENVFLADAADESDLVKITEIGSVRNHDEVSIKDLEYLAPEQNSSVAEADERSDIYSLGVIFYEMLAGEVPHAAENPTELMLKHAEDAPKPLSAFRADLPGGVEPVVLKALAKDPEERYQTAGEFSDYLLAAANSKAIAAGKIWKTFAIVLVGIVALSALLIYALSSKQRNPETMQVDAGGQPVQPINPATGISEQGLSNMMQIPPEMFANSNMNIPPGTLPGGDGFNPWANPGQFQQIPPGGQTITIDPNNPSQFMPPDGTILIPATPTPSPQPSPATTKTPAIEQPTPATSNTPVPANTKPAVPSTEKTPTKKNTKPAAQSDKKQDTD